LYDFEKQFEHVYTRQSTPALEAAIFKDILGRGQNMDSQAEYEIMAVYWGDLDQARKIKFESLLILKD
jgi:hypothetical protein